MRYFKKVIEIIIGKGNKDTDPDWNVNLGMLSYEHEYVSLTGQYYSGKGN
jgi:hypothetical protein